MMSNSSIFMEATKKIKENVDSLYALHKYKFFNYFLRRYIGECSRD